MVHMNRETITMKISRIGIMGNVQNYWWILNAAIDQRRASRHTFSYDLPCMKLKTMKDSTLVLVSFRGVLHNEQQ